MTKSVLQALPFYVMQTVNLPGGLCEEVDRGCRSFIWGDTDQSRRSHLIAWDNVCRPKQYGGLGLRKTRDSNRAFMMKASWRLCSQPSSLWSLLIRSKYKCGNQCIPLIKKEHSGINFWRSICNSWDLFLQGVTWRVGNGGMLDSGRTVG